MTPKNQLSLKKKALEVSRSIGLKQIESYAIDGLAKLYLDANDLSNAEKYLPTFSHSSRIGF